MYCYFTNNPGGLKLARKKARPTDLKNQRWAGIVAAILALGMVVSLVGAYIGQAVGGGGAPLPDQQVEPEPEDYLNYYEGEVERLEEQIRDGEVSETLLLELAENYRYLTIVKQVFFDDQEALEEYEDKLVSVFLALVDLEPSNPAYRLELINLYVEQRENEALITGQAAEIQELLREDPDPMLHLSFIQLLSTAGKEELYVEEAVWLEDYLETRVASGEADNEERFYYAVLLGEYRGDPAAAEDILESILEQEDEQSVIYQNALSYLEYFRADNDEQDIMFE